jgi:hypothetical protein
MVKRLRQFFESVVFAGLKPGAPRGQSKLMGWLGPLRGPIERFLSGGPAPSDPFYLTNRTFGQKVKLGILIAAPCLIVAGFVGIALMHVFGKSTAGPAPEPTAAEVLAKILPNMAKDIKIDVNRDVEVVEVHVDHTGDIKLSGTLKNNTSRAVAAEVVFDLTDAAGSQVGAVSGQVEGIAPNATANFQFPIKQQDAAFALVREVRTR